MNLLLLYASEREASSNHDAPRFVVTGDRARHLIADPDTKVGRELRVGVLEGPLGTGQVVRIDDGRLVVTCTLQAEPPPRPKRDLILAVPRPKVLRRLLPQIASLGVDRLVLVRSWRVERSYLTAKVLRSEVYTPLLHEGLMQACCTRAPRVTIEPLFKPYVEDRLPGAFDGVGLVAHPHAKARMAIDCVAPGAPAVVAVGPEGGWLPYEVEAFVKAGFIEVGLGNRILKVETACVGLLAHIDMLQNRRERRS